MFKLIEYITNQGDTWDSIAKQFFNNEYNMTELLELNPQHSKVRVFKANIRLKIPKIEKLTDSVDKLTPPWRR